MLWSLMKRAAQRAALSQMGEWKSPHDEITIAVLVALWALVVILGLIYR
jgi:hypothetical protein